MHDRLATDPICASWVLTSVAAVSALPAVLGGSGCEPADEVEDGFHIAHVGFEDDSTIRLTFSQPIATFGSINPNQFRLSLAQTVTASYVYNGGTETFTYTTYLDVSTLLDDDYAQRFLFKSIEPGAANDEIILRTSKPLRSKGCAWFEETEELFELYASHPDFIARFDHAIFLHYAAAEIPIADVTGRELPDIGGDWVRSAANYAAHDDFGFRRLDPQLRIPCP